MPCRDCAGLSEIRYCIGFGSRELCKAVVADMIEIIADESTLSDERERAMLTAVEASFPSLNFDFFSMYDDMRLSPTAQSHRDKMADELNSFSNAAG